jgi:fused signal recognition particle receptor
MDLFSWAKTVKADEERKREEEARLEAEKAERQRLEEARLEAEKAEREKKKMLERDRQQTAKKQRLDEMLAKVRKKYGDNAIHKGSES